MVMGGNTPGCCVLGIESPGLHRPYLVTMWLCRHLILLLHEEIIAHGLCSMYLSPGLILGFSESVYF